ncbi:MAG: hypothetical protein HZA77_03165 [Candidatus Schekmanbacteria bacterium]|nr:hypothetical protein [Candidatus Schekmanbacteria bacterium]
MLTDETDSNNFNDALTVNYIDKYPALGMPGWIYLYWQPRGKGDPITSAHYQNMTAESHFEKAGELKKLARMEKKNADIFKRLKDKKRRERSLKKSAAYEEAARHHELKANGTIEEEFYVDEEEALIDNLKGILKISEESTDLISDLIEEIKKMG